MANGGLTPEEKKLIASHTAAGHEELVEAMVRYCARVGRTAESLLAWIVALQEFTSLTAAGAAVLASGSGEEVLSHLPASAREAGQAINRRVEEMAALNRMGEGR